MAVTFLFSAVAAIAYIPVAALLFLILDRYAEPNVPKSLFDERKVMLTFLVGIALGLILSVIFVLYTFYLSQGANGIGGAFIVAILFLFVAATLRRLLVHTKTFGGIGGSDPLLPVHTLSYGAVSGGTIALGLGLDLFGTSTANTLYTLAVLTGISVDLILVEAWAGLRFGRAMRKGFAWLPPTSILVGEGLALLAIAPLFSGAAYLGDALLVVMFVVAAWSLHQEERRALKALRRAVGVEKEPRQGRFGRGAAEPATSPEPEERGDAPGDGAGGATPLPSEDPPRPPSTG